MEGLDTPHFSSLCQHNLFFCGEAVKAAIAGMKPEAALGCLGHITSVDVLADGKGMTNSPLMASSLAKDLPAELQKVMHKGKATDFLFAHL